MSVGKTVEFLINWDCEVIKNYAKENRGVYQNIGEGARWVFEREEKAIFLEDDNLPETSFFRFASEMLEKYETAPEVLWICGTQLYNRNEWQGKLCIYTTLVTLWMGIME